jgi:hypothetical protein
MLFAALLRDEEEMWLINTADQEAGLANLNVTGRCPISNFGVPCTISLQQAAGLAWIKRPPWKWVPRFHALLLAKDKCCYNCC